MTRFLMSHWLMVGCLLLAVIVPHDAAALFGAIAAVILGGAILAFIPMFSFLSFARRYLSTGIAAACLFFAAGWIADFRSGLSSPSGATASAAAMPVIDDPSALGLTYQVRARADVVPVMYERPGMLSILGMALGGAFGFAALMFWKNRAGAEPLVTQRTHPSIVDSLRRADRFTGFTIGGSGETNKSSSAIPIDPDIEGYTALGRPVYRAGVAIPKGIEAAPASADPVVIGTSALGQPVYAAQPKVTTSRLATKPGRAQIVALRCRKLLGLRVEAPRDEDAVIVDVNCIEALRGEPRIAELLA